MNWRFSVGLLLASGCTLGLTGLRAAEATGTGTVPAGAPADGVAGWRQSVEQELRGNILPFWINHTVDHERGGFYGQISNDLKVRKDAIRGALLTSRILWTYSSAYLRYQDPAYLKMATWAYEDLVKRYWDGEYGGLYWSVTADGEPVSMIKQIYGQVFGVYALSEYYRATHDQAALDKAVAIYRLVEKNGRDHERGGYFEACTREWKRDANKRTTVMEPEGAKSQNTHIHILEAYTNLLRAWPDAGLKQAHRELMEVLLQKILDPRTHHLILFLGEDWKPKTSTVSYGHDIEFSWLITEAAEVQGDEELSKTVKKAALEIAAVTLAEGVQKDGSLIYESDPNGKVNTDREWWPQAEAAVGFYNAYQLSGDKRYRDEARKVWGYIEENLVDHKDGEWFRARTSQGKVVPTPKVSMWKCPYHNGRSCLELLGRLDRR